MFQKVAIFLLMIVIASGCVVGQAAAPAPASPAPEPAYFPLAKGAYWVYEGLVRWQAGTQVLEQPITWTMEVRDVVERGPVTGYLLRGHPADLAWYTPGKRAGDYVIVQVDNRYYLAEAEIWPRLMDETDQLFGLVEEGQLFLAAPLQPGQVFGEADQITRLDRSYCWVVQHKESVQLAAVEERVIQYRLMFRTRPDHQVVEFAPGVGITRYVYGHHGTVSDVDVRLVEYRPAVSQVATVTR